MYPIYLWWNTPHGFRVPMATVRSAAAAPCFSGATSSRARGKPKASWWHRGGPGGCYTLGDLANLANLACMYVRMYVRTYVCMYVRRYVCMCIFLCIYWCIYIYNVYIYVCILCIYMCVYLVVNNKSDKSQTSNTTFGEKIQAELRWSAGIPKSCPSSPWW